MAKHLKKKKKKKRFGHWGSRTIPKGHGATSATLNMVAKYPLFFILFISNMK
jgi:hypothetical protein